MESSQQLQKKSPAAIEVRDLTLRHGERVLIRSLDFSVGQGEIFAVIGASGCGKSTLLNYLAGLQLPASGEGSIRLLGKDMEELIAAPAERPRTCGVLFQTGALWTSMTLLENLSLPLSLHGNFSPKEVEEMAAFTLALVGLRGYEHHRPHEISGGMAKRAGIARAMVLDPPILFLDEPSAGLDPVTSKNLDELILGIRRFQGTTIVLVTHELRSIFRVADRAAYLDRESNSLLEIGPPDALARHSLHPNVREFFLENDKISEKLPGSVVVATAPTGGGPRQ
ncbi:MAG: ATP-binding cassette domain-containing protein [Puniceicoccales bacterium]|jgi:phospholipid/cholesterol/gamma-HCH transport system ATP-binding protein|nr:ATP-binding cassette domain-containing protein [Puniceicoccales bacterium]